MQETIIWSLIIFIGRLVDIGLGTIRINLIMRRKKTIAGVVSFFEATIFIAIIVRVISEINNIYGIISYAAGFAIGTVVGIIISEKLSMDLVSINIISKRKSVNIKSLLRKDGFGITCYEGTGKDDNVEVINVVCKQTDLPRLNKLVYGEDRWAFMVSYTLDKIRGGFIRGLKKK